ncbi:MAG TPA: hypothetical protein VFS24_18550, partial [Steroidobacteraceae bacterium]|nr:hypothetical protein [Steroidobacteraceae bacterium]
MQTISLRSIFRVLFLSTLILPSLWAFGADAPPVMRASAQAFGHLPEVTDMALSPNGKLLGWIDNSGPICGIVVMDADTGKILRKLAFEQTTKLRKVEWSDDETLLVNVSATDEVTETDRTYEWFRTIAVDVATGASRVLLMDDYRRDFVTGSRLLASHPSRPHTVVMSSWDYSSAEASRITRHIRAERQLGGWVVRLFDVDTRTGKGKPIDAGNQLTQDYLLDADGTPIVRSEFNPNTRV